MKTFVALDLETTGFDPINDQVIEIAALKYQDGKIVDRFDTLVNPKIPIPPMVTHITGIKAEDLTDAPEFGTIRDKLIAFIGKEPIVGHNIPFDISFLNQKGMGLLNPLYDTLQLATILLPGLSSYSLDTLSRILKIKHENKHRAMSDTKACAELFLMLEKKICEVPEDILEEIRSIVSRSDWELQEMFLKTVSTTNQKYFDEPAEKPEDPGTERTAGITNEEVLDYYRADGPIAKVMHPYEERPSQKIFTQNVLESFANEKNLLVEAGTGTGKTLAYLLAAAAWSLQKSEPVIISTYTLNLQEQICKKDIPLVEKILEAAGHPVRLKTTPLKGRRNYLSLKRLESFLKKDWYFDHEVTLLIKILLWLKQTKTGDLQELSIQGKEFTILDEICCAEFVCPHDDLEFKNGCYLMKARSQAERSHIVVINHALLVQNAVSESPLLPESSYLVVDEAHHLEKVSTDALTITLSHSHFIRPFEKIVRIMDELSHAKTNLFSSEETFQNIKNLRTFSNQIISKADIFFGLIGILLEKQLGPSDFQYHLNLKPAHFQTQDWQKISMSSQNAIEIAGQLKTVLEDLVGQLEESAPASWKELKGMDYECEKRIHDLTEVMKETSVKDRIRWIFKTPEGNICLKSAPYSIGDKIREILFDKKRSTILTSATLSTDQNFSFIREQLGLDQSFEELSLPSHFSYPDQVKILIPQDLAEPLTEGYFLQCSELIANIIRGNKGRTLVLFTSKKALAATYHAIAPKLKQEGFTVLGQNITGGRGKILEHFKDEASTSAIFGTASFWEGVDIQGDILTCVVMQKLPFDPPDDPIILARSQKYHDSFNEFQLPRAILKFKQGFGRLIRSSEDTGSIVILDSRIIQKSYGTRFLQSLPQGIKIDFTTRRELAGLL